MKDLVKLRKMKVDELKNQIKDYKKEALNLRFQKSTGQLENVSRVSKVRKEIARIKTIINELKKKD